MTRPKTSGATPFCPFFRDNPAAISRELKKRGEAEVRWGNVELATFVITLATMAWFNWRWVVFFLPFMYLGHCFQLPQRVLSALRRQSRTSRLPGACPPMARFTTGFSSTTATTPNTISGPRPTGRGCTTFYLQIQEKQREAGVRVLSTPHMLGFLDPDLPTKSRPLGEQPAEVAPATTGLSAALRRPRFRNVRPGLRRTDAFRACL